MSKSHEGRIERLVPQHISYPEQLPVVARRDEIMRAIAENQVVVIAGETGSGKTTQLPKMCLELGRGRATGMPACWPFLSHACLGRGLVGAGYAGCCYRG